MKIWTIEDLESEVKVLRPQRAGQLARAKQLLTIHPEAVIMEVADENSGYRFGRVPHREGMCEKIGGCRQPYYYQMWVSWAPKDVAKK